MYKGKRSIIFDTETTGLNTQEDRVIEVACVESIDCMPTGREYHVYINPECEIPEEATRIHGITDDMVKGMPIFSDIADDFLEFIGDSELVAHNAQFDIEIVSSELKRAGYNTLKHKYVDTISRAKEKFGGNSMSLDTLCRKLKIDISARVKHGALIDTRLLAEAYLRLNGGRDLAFDFAQESQAPLIIEAKFRTARSIGEPREDEIEAHQKYISQTFSKIPSLWGDSQAQAPKI